MEYIREDQPCCASVSIYMRPDSNLFCVRLNLKMKRKKNKWREWEKGRKFWGEVSAVGEIAF